MTLKSASIVIGFLNLLNHVETVSLGKNHVKLAMDFAVNVIEDAKDS